MARRMKLRSGWSILSKHTGLYYGSFYRTRKDAIADHCRATGRTWDYCIERRLDVAIRTTIYFEPYPKEEPNDR